MSATIVQLLELFEQIKSGRITGDALQRLLENPDRYEQNLGRFGRLYPLTISYGMSVENLVLQNVFSGQVSQDVSAERFPAKHQGRRDVVLELYEFDSTITGEDAARRIEEDGYANEDAHALLTFGKEHPMEQLRRPIAALGQHRLRHVPCLDCSGGGERALYLRKLADRFNPCCRFLVSRKIT